MLKTNIKSPKKVYSTFHFVFLESYPCPLLNLKDKVFALMFRTTMNLFYICQC